jgi:hypothetical protein
VENLIVTKTTSSMDVEDGMATLFVDSEGVLVSKVKKGNVSLREMDENYVHLKSITKGTSVCGIIESQYISSFNKDYILYIEREYSKIYKALAIVAPSGWMRLKSKYTLRFSKSKFPIKLFANSTQAKIWLKSHL